MVPVLYQNASIVPWFTDTQYMLLLHTHCQILVCEIVTYLVLFSLLLFY